MYSIKELFVNSNVDNDTFIVSNAKVTISNKDVKKEMLYNSTLKKYTLKANEMLILEGEEYSIEVEVEGFKKLTGSTIIPRKNTDILNFRDLGDNLPSNYNNLFIEFKDIPDQENYYHIYASVHYENDSDENRYQAVSFLHNRDPLGVNNINEKEYPRSLLISDNKLDGQKLIAEGIRYGYYRYPKLITLKVQLLSVDKYYYDYHQLIFTQDDNNPLVEPANIKGNIVNGIGVFSGYQLHEKIFKYHL